MTQAGKQGGKDTGHTAETCRMLADFFFILSNQTRMALFCSLQEGTKPVSQLAAEVDKTIQNVSQHLRLMREKEIVCTIKQGQQIFYSIVDDRLVEGCRLMRDAFIDRLQNRVSMLDSSLLGNTGRGPSGECPGRTDTPSPE
jgi:DNA-binding transcriptional ArsR family regulator